MIMGRWHGHGLHPAVFIGVRNSISFATLSAKGYRLDGFGMIGIRLQVHSACRDEAGA
jgi:hypothetical protein